MLEATLNETLTREVLDLWPEGQAANDESDLVGNRPAQESLFGSGEDRLRVQRQSALPDPEAVRSKLKALLEKARTAEKMPWTEREARMWRTVFPNMAKWLPEDEANQLRFAFAQEMERLQRVA